MAWGILLCGRMVGDSSIWPDPGSLLGDDGAGSVVHRLDGSGSS